MGGNQGTGKSSPPPITIMGRGWGWGEGQEPNGSCPWDLTSCRGQAGVQGTNRTVGVSL